MQMGCFNWAPTQASLFTITVRVTDLGVLSSSQSFTLTVTP